MSEFSCPMWHVHISSDLDVLSRSEGQVPFGSALQRRGLPRGSSGHELLCGLFHPCLHCCCGCDQWPDWVSQAGPFSALQDSEHSVSRAPEESGWISERSGWSAERACTHPGDPRGNEMGRRSLYLVTWLSKQPRRTPWRCFSSFLPPPEAEAFACLWEQQVSLSCSLRGDRGSVRGILVIL